MQPPDLTTRNPAPDLALPWVVRLRYGMALGGAVVLALASVRFGLSAALACSFVPLAAVLVSNLLLARLRAQVERAPESAVAAVLAMDTLCLTVMLGLTGGSANPFSLLYLVQITLSAVVLEKTWTWALGALSMVCFGALFFWRVPFTPFEGHHIDSASPHLVGMWVAFVIAAALIAFFTGKISEALRRREREVLSLQDRIAKNERLASLATLAAGAAHELGTPLGTIAVVARELELYAAHMGNGQAVEEDARLIRSEIERSRLILQQMSADGGEPMGEAVRQIAARDLARQAVAQRAWRFSLAGLLRDRGDRPASHLRPNLRAVVKPVLHRKNALFYKTLHGAEVGDLFMSLIHTCQLSGANSFEYLTELQRRAREVATRPVEWMPWNYREAVARAPALP